MKDSALACQEFWVWDTFHFFHGGESFSVFDEVNPKKVFLFHVADVANVPLSEVGDACRVLPKDSILFLRPFIRKLEGIVYQDSFSIELFNPAYWEGKLGQVAHLRYGKVQELFR